MIPFRVLLLLMLLPVPAHFQSTAVRFVETTNVLDLFCMQLNFCLVRYNSVQESAILLRLPVQIDAADYAIFLLHVLDQLSQVKDRRVSSKRGIVVLHIQITAENI